MRGGERRKSRGERAKRYAAGILTEIGYVVALGAVVFGLGLLVTVLAR